MIIDLRGAVPPGGPPNAEGGAPAKPANIRISDAMAKQAIRKKRDSTHVVRQWVRLCPSYRVEGMLRHRILTAPVRPHQSPVL